MIKLLDILSEEISLLLEISKSPSPIGPTNVISSYGESRTVGPHKGIDLRASVGTNILCPSDGVVKDAVTVTETFNEIISKKGESKINGNDRCGSRIIIEHTSEPLKGLKTIFCHLNSVNVNKGQEIKKGDLIGTTGGERNGKGSGYTTGPHLHLGLKKNNQFLNPTDYFDFNTSIISVGDEVSHLENFNNFIKNNFNISDVIKTEIQPNFNYGESEYFVVYIKNKDKPLYYLINDNDEFISVD